MSAFFDLLAAAPPTVAKGQTIGFSREGRELEAFAIGSGRMPISLIAGAHADEPVGPLLLSKLVNALLSLPENHPMLTDYCWWIVPHCNPDGAERNKAWFDAEQRFISLGSYLQHVVRELPGDDLEFSFPKNDSDTKGRPESLAIYRWWETSGTSFVLHASLHSMAFAGGAWFLIDPAWIERTELLRKRCRAASAALGYQLHDVERFGEKGFSRIEPGFCTRPNSKAMAAYFLEQNDRSTAALFRPSSMEAIRSLHGDVLTLVSELPFFVLPGVGIDIGPPDKKAEHWKSCISAWKQRISKGAPPHEIDRLAAEAGVTSMPIIDQMRLQWVFIESALEIVSQQA